VIDGVVHLLDEDAILATTNGQYGGLVFEEMSMSWKETRILCLPTIMLLPEAGDDAIDGVANLLDGDATLTTTASQNGASFMRLAM
jgi:hypothetical protein